MSPVHGRKALPRPQIATAPAEPANTTFRAPHLCPSPGNSNIDMHACRGGGLQQDVCRRFLRRLHPEPHPAALPMHHDVLRGVSQHDGVPAARGATPPPLFPHACRPTALCSCIHTSHRVASHGDRARRYARIRNPNPALAATHAIQGGNVVCLQCMSELPSHGDLQMRRVNAGVNLPRLLHRLSVAPAFERRAALHPHPFSHTRAPPTCPHAARSTGRRWVHRAQTRRAHHRSHKRACRAPPTLACMSNMHV